MTDFELHWLAGLLEGEGSFLCGPPSSPNSVGVSVQMTDEDVIAKVAALFGTKYHKNKPSKNHHKPSFSARVRGPRAADLMLRLRPLLGSRRQGQIDRALASQINRKKTWKLPPEKSVVIDLFRTGISRREVARRLACDRGYVNEVIRGC